MRSITSQPRVLLALVVVLGTLAIWLKLSRYPTRAEVARTLDQLSSLSSSRRTRVLSELVGRLRDADSAAQRDAMQHALSQLETFFRTEHYPEILEALDRADLEGDFKPAVCALYAHLRDEPQLRVRYRTDARALERCIGFGLSADDLAQLTGGEPR